MKALLVFLLTASAVLAQKPKPRPRPGISDCFKVRALIRADEAHYWADWANACPYTIDRVYVLVAFNDKSNRHVGDGVWPLYFVTPGAHRVIRFSVSSEVADFAFVHLQKITVDEEEGLRSQPVHAERAQLPPGLVGDPGASKIARLAESSAVAVEGQSSDGLADTGVVSH
jgi:hypothetical protein